MSETKFKKGDIVRILRIPTEQDKVGWNNNWNPNMNAAVGKTGTVLNSFNSIGYLIDVPFITQRNYYYPESILELVVSTRHSPKRRPQLVATNNAADLKQDRVLASRFKPGDKVRVHYPEYTSPLEGQIATVISRTTTGYVRIWFEGQNMYSNLFPQRLTLVAPVKAAPTQPALVATNNEADLKPDRVLANQFKAGDKVRVHYPDYRSEYENQIGTVMSPAARGYVKVRFKKGATLNLYPQRLTLIESLATIPSEEETASVQETQSSLVPSTETAKKARGIAGAVKSHSTAFVVASNIARNLGLVNPTVNADQVQQKLAEAGYKSTDLGNAAGSLFRGKAWQKAGTTKSARFGNHAREITNWKYIGA